MFSRLGQNFDAAPLVASLATILLLLAGSLYSPNFLSPDYLLQQLQVAAFLGIVATGAMLVILLGQIDLSMPWVLTAGAVMATGAETWLGGSGTMLAIPFGIVCGAAFGLINGIGVAYLRVPSMIFTLGMNAVAHGLIVVQTGGFAPQDRATPAMHFLATGKVLGTLPVSVIVWAILGAATLFLLRHTAFGRQLYAIGNKERAAYLSGSDTRRIVLVAFVLSALTASLAGILLAGYATKAFQGMGDAYLLPAIAAVVLGGTNILGGKGSYFGTVAGVILITVLQSILSVMQMPEMGRQIIYGVVIIAMLLVYGRGNRIAG